MLKGSSLDRDHPEWKYPKCDSTEFKKKHVRLAGLLGYFNRWKQQLVFTIIAGMLNSTQNEVRNNESEKVRLNSEI